MKRPFFGQLWLIVTALLLCAPACAEFIRPRHAGDPLVYGVKNGIVVAVYPFSFDSRPQGGPRGLIRIGQDDGGKFHLLNFIAVEPLVGSDQGLSELEPGGDGQPGKRFWVGDSLQDGGVGRMGNTTGRIQETPDGRTLSFVLHVEPFANGASPVIEVSLSERHPDRVRFRTFSAAGGKPMARCTLTATMGNQSRCRTLWLRAGPVSAPALYDGYSGTGFVEKAPYPLAALERTAAGDVVAAITPDEFEPCEVWPLPNDAWHEDCPWLAQFWLKPRGTFNRSLQCRVNGRRVYWGGDFPIPGGIAFENFEFRERFHPGQEVWFGFTPDSPARAFGFRYDASPQATPRRQIPAGEAAAIADAVRLARPLTNGDFTDGLAGWQREGGADAFRTFNTGSSLALTTYGRRKEADTGRLYQCFQVPASASVLRFSLHGGGDSAKTYVALWQRDRLCRKMTARNDNAPFRVRWDVTALRGKVVTLEIVDESTAPWGFLGVQDFTLTR